MDALPELIGGGGMVQEVKLPEITVRVAINRQLVIESAEFKNLKEES